MRGVSVNELGDSFGKNIICFQVNVFVVATKFYLLDDFWMNSEIVLAERWKNIPYTVYSPLGQMYLITNAKNIYLSANWKHLSILS